MLGLYNIDSNTLHHSEIMSHHNEMVSNESELSMISETNDISLEPEDNNHAFVETVCPNFLLSLYLLLFSDFIACKHAVI